MSTYDKLKDEDAMDAELKAAIQRGDSEQKQNAIIDAFTEPAPEGMAL